MDSLVGKTIRWTFDDGPVRGIPFEHIFDAEGVTWRYAGGEHEGASRREQPYSAVKVNDKTWAVSYRAASGHTLTAILNLDDGRMIAYASDGASWFVSHGTFDLNVSS